jgi:hypothetical protein
MWSGPSSLPKLMVSSKPVLEKPNHARTAISPSIGSLLPTSQQAKEHATGFSNPLLGNSLCATFPFQTAKGKQTTSLGSNSPTKMIELKETPPATGIWPTSKMGIKGRPPQDYLFSGCNHFSSRFFFFFSHLSSSGKSKA